MEALHTRPAVHCCRCARSTSMSEQMAHSRHLSSRTTRSPPQIKLCDIALVIRAAAFRWTWWRVSPTPPPLRRSESLPPTKKTRCVVGAILNCILIVCTSRKSSSVGWWGGGAQRARRHDHPSTRLIPKLLFAVSTIMLTFLCADTDHLPSFVT